MDKSNDKPKRASRRRHSRRRRAASNQQSDNLTLSSAPRTPDSTKILVTSSNPEITTADESQLSNKTEAIPSQVSSSEGNDAQAIKPELQINHQDEPKDQQCRDASDASNKSQVNVHRDRELQIQNHGSDVTPPVNAVRTLFKDQQDKERVSTGQQGLQTATDETRSATDFRSPNQTNQQNQTSIVIANRRLIEQQIEAIQEADSRRWNFDFSSCRPLALPDHRYMHLSNPSNNNDNNTNNNNNNDRGAEVNCRPLCDQNSIIASRSTNQSRWSAQATRGNHPDRSDHKQQKEG